MLGNKTLSSCSAADYSVGFSSACGGSIELQIPSANICGITWSRQLDLVSEACVVITGDACAGWPGSDICLGAAYLVVERNGIVEWSGPTTRKQCENGRLTICAYDPMWWAGKRMIQTDEINNLTPLEAFRELLKHLNGESLCGCDVSGTLCFSNILEGPACAGVYTIEKSSIEAVSSQMQALADTWIDWTVVGTDLYYGCPSVPIPEERQGSLPTLTNQSFNAAPIVSCSIEEYATCLIAANVPPTEAELEADEEAAAKTIIEGECTEDKSGVHEVFADYGDLTEEDDIRALLSTQLSTSNASNWSLQLTPDSTFLPGIAWDIPRMVPGIILDVDLNVCGQQFVGKAQLISLNVSVSSAKEVVTGVFESL